LACENQVLICLQPCPLRQGQDVAAIKTALRAKIDVFDRASGRAVRQS
jgi:hypothetical protein